MRYVTQCLLALPFRLTSAVQSHCWLKSLKIASTVAHPRTTSNSIQGSGVLLLMTRVVVSLAPQANLLRLCFLVGDGAKALLSESEDALLPTPSLSSSSLLLSTPSEDSSSPVVGPGGGGPRISAGRPLRNIVVCGNRNRQHLDVGELVHYQQRHFKF